MTYKLIVLIFLMYSCNSKSNENRLIISLKNKSLVTYCSDTECSKDVMYLNENYYNYFNKSKNILHIKIENKSKKNYLLMLTNSSNYLFKKTSFPNKLYGLDLENLVVSNNSTNKRVKHYNSFVNEIINNCENYTDSNFLKTHNKLGYSNKNNWLIKNNNISKQIIQLPSNQVVYFETFVNLPFNKYSSGSFQSVELNRDNKYSCKITINSDTTNIKEHLTWSQLKNIEENNYKLFHGTITSKNTVPIEFVD